jgi:hypothetical protein
MSGDRVFVSLDHTCNGVILGYMEHCSYGSGTKLLDGQKIIKVDWNSIDSLSKHSRHLNARIRELENNGIGAMERVKKGQKFVACYGIWETDISSIYSELSLNATRSYFVYAHLDPLQPIDLTRARNAFAATIGMEYLPFYIGKGINDRDKDLMRNETHRKIVQKLRAIGKEPVVVKVQQRLTESEALQCESKLIDIFGLMPNGGFLTNLDEGHNRIARRTLYRNYLRKLCRTPGDYERLSQELFMNYGCKKQ